MRFSQAEKHEIIRLVEESSLGVKKTLEELKIPRSTFYKWYKLYSEGGYEGLGNKKRNIQTYWNVIPADIKKDIVDFSLEFPDLTPREIAIKYTDSKGYFISESSVYRILKKNDLITSPAYVVMEASSEFKDKTTRVNQMWQTDFTYFKIIGWGWYYLSTVLDDFSRYIIHWELCSTMDHQDAERTIKSALIKSGLSNSEYKPKVLSDNGPAYISGELAEYFEKAEINHIRGRPYHPQTQGKIERYHRSMKNIVKLENYYSPSQLEFRLQEFVEYYNNLRYHESLNNVAPADVYFNRKEEIIQKRNQIKINTMRKRKKNYLFNLIN
jgi:transposase InsO family protein